MDSRHTGGQLGLLCLLCLLASFSIGAKAILPSLPLPVRLVTQFPLGVWIENLYVRSDGDILLTTTEPSASVYLVSNPASASPHVSLVHTFDEINAVLGIEETEPNIFAVAGMNLSSPGHAATGSSGVWEIDLRNFRAKPRVRQIASMIDAVLPNGVEKLPGSPNIILIADSGLGLVWRFNTRTGHYSVAIRDPTMAIANDASLPIGINGLRVHRGYLYWTNSFKASIYRMRITPEGYRAHGAAAELVSHVNAEILDDLFFGPEHHDIIWTPTNIDNMLLAVDGRTGASVVVDGAPGQLTVAGDTACRFGRGPSDKEILYVVTSGALGAPVNGTVTEGGKVVAVNTGSFFHTEDRISKEWPLEKANKQYTLGEL